MKILQERFNVFLHAFTQDKGKERPASHALTKYRRLEITGYNTAGPE
jgi:hypothetical protein